MITQNLNLNVRFLIMLFFWTFEMFAIMHETTLSRPNGTGKFFDIFPQGLKETLVMRLNRKKNMFYDSFLI